MGSMNYNKTKRACYLGFVTQAIVVNFTPLLFLIFHREYKISISCLALILLLLLGRSGRDRGFDAVLQALRAGQLVDPVMPLGTHTFVQYRELLHLPHRAHREGRGEHDDDAAPQKRTCRPI